MESAGVLLPIQKGDCIRLTWWINWCNFWGSILYCIGGVVADFRSKIAFHPDFQIENAISLGFGSCCFIVSGLLSFVKISLKAGESLDDAASASDSNPADATSSNGNNNNIKQLQTEAVELAVAV